MSKRLYKQLHVSQLRTFCECVRRKSYSAAARALGISQPVVWQQVKALERDLGVSLLRRRGRELEPSEDGRLLLELAGAIVASVDSLHETFQERRHEIPRTLVVVADPGAIIQELARPTVEFCRAYPQVQLSLVPYGNPQVLEMVISGQAHLGVTQFGQVARRSSQLVSELICSRPWALFVPAGHPLLKKRRLALADIVPYLLVLSNTDGHWRKQVDELFRSAGLLDAMRVAAQVNNMEAGRRFVSLGLGISLMPQPLDGLEFPNLCSRPLSDFLPEEQIVAIWRRGATLSPPARSFLDVVRCHLAKE